MGARRKPKVDPLAVRVRHLVALDATNVLRRLTARQDQMVALFSRLRDRGPLVETLASWFLTARFEDLVALEPLEQRAINDFYAQLDELRWYLRYTEDMPLQVRQRLVKDVRALDEALRALLAVIGGLDDAGAKVVDAL